MKGIRFAAIDRSMEVSFEIGFYPHPFFLDASWRDGRRTRDSVSVSRSRSLASLRMTIR